MRAIILRALALSFAAVAVGCSGEIDNLPTTPDPVIVTETFTGTLNVNGAVTHNVFTGRHRIGLGDADLARRQSAREGRLQHGNVRPAPPARPSCPTTMRS